MHTNGKEKIPACYLYIDKFPGHWMTCAASADKAERRFDCFLLVRSNKLSLVVGMIENSSDGF